MRIENWLSSIIYITLPERDFVPLPKVRTPPKLSAGMIQYDSLQRKSHTDPADPSPFAPMKHLKTKYFLTRTS